MKNVLDNTGGTFNVLFPDFCVLFIVIVVITKFSAISNAYSNILAILNKQSCSDVVYCKIIEKLALLPDTYTHQKKRRGKKVEVYKI